MAEHYKLNADHTVSEVGLMGWAASFEGGASRRVASTELPDRARVSTVFLGLDHSFGEGPPLLFETMVFQGGWGDLLCWRYSTYAQAEAGHAAAVALVESYQSQGRPLDGLSEEAQPRDSDAMLGTKPAGLSPEGVAARACSEAEGIAHE